MLVSELLALDSALIVIEGTANWHLAAIAALSGVSSRFFSLKVAIRDPGPD